MLVHSADRSGRLSARQCYAMTVRRERGWVIVALGKKTHTITPKRQMPSPNGGKRDDSAVGGALRAAYKSAVDEAIPPEMLDLLSKLR
jgi:hypothetical protein